MNNQAIFNSTRLSFLAIVVFALFAGLATASAQINKSLSLDEVIRIAADNSREMVSAKHRFRSSFWEYKTFRSQYYPMLKLNTTMPGINRSIQKYTHADGSETFITMSSANYSANLSLSKIIGATGGSLYVNSGMQRMDNLASPLSTNYLTNPVSVGLNQPILAYNPYRWSNKIEPLKYEEARRKFLEDREQVAITAVSSFFDLLQSTISMKIAVTNEANYDTLYKIAKGRYNLGKIAENELLQLELSYLQAKAQVENAKLDLEMNTFKLKSFLRLPEKSELNLFPPSQIPDVKADLGIAQAEARTNRSDKISFDRQRKEAESQVMQAKLDNRFNANLFVQYGLTATAPNYEEAYKNPQDEQLLTFGIQIPILDWGYAKGKIRMAESNRELVQTNVEQQEIDSEQEVFLKVMQFNMQKNQVAIAAKADTVAQKRFYVSKQRYLIGKIDITDLNIAQTETDSARLGYISALRTLWRSYYELRRLTLYDFVVGKPISFEFSSVAW
ncbi:MAG: TolC family protein [Bacteroidota bacterium]